MCPLLGHSATFCSVRGNVIGTLFVELRVWPDDVLRPIEMCRIRSPHVALKLALHGSIIASLMLGVGSRVWVCAPWPCGVRTL